MIKRTFLKKNILPVFLLLLCLSFHSISYGFPFWSHANTSGLRYNNGIHPHYLEQYYDYDSSQSWSFSYAGIVRIVNLPHIETWVVANPITDALGYAIAYSNPMTSTLKLKAYSHNVSNEIIKWDVCWNRICWPWAPGEFWCGIGRAYARSVWEVKSDTLPIGEPISLGLSISLDGEIKGNQNNDGRVDVRMYAWLSTPEILSNYVEESPQGVMNSLRNDSYPAVYGWWEDVGYHPSLSIYAGNSSANGQITFKEEVSRIFGSSDGSCGGSPCPHPPSPLTEIRVGDILILELELWGGTSVWNDINNITSIVEADFYNTGSARFNILTEGVYLSPVPLPSTLILFATGSGVIALYRKMRKKG